MADIRINALANTASTTSSDDFLAVDGTTNGTRKLNAYSPTFGGNLTVSGGTIGTAALTSLTLNGGSTGSSLVLGASAAGTTLTTQNGPVSLVTGTDGNLSVTSSGRPKITAEVTAGNNAGASMYLVARSTGGTRRSWAFETDTTAAGDFAIRISSAEGGTSFSDALYFNSSKNATLAGNLTVSGTDIKINAATGYLYVDSGSSFTGFELSRSSNVVALYTANTERLRVNSSGNLLLGTTTDSGNGKLQLATHTTSAGGIGFGTEYSLYRINESNIALNSTSVFSSTLGLYLAGSLKGSIGIDTASVYVGSRAAGYSTIILSGNSTTALTLDSSQNATFVGQINVVASNKFTLSHNGSQGDIQTFTSTPLYINRQGNAVYFGNQTVSIDPAAGNLTMSGGVQTAAPSGGTFARWKLGTVATVSPTSPNRTIEVEIGGTTYYIHAKTTNN